MGVEGESYQVHQLRAFTRRPLATSKDACGGLLRIMPIFATTRQNH